MSQREWVLKQLKQGRRLTGATVEYGEYYLPEEALTEERTEVIA